MVNCPFIYPLSINRQLYFSRTIDLPHPLIPLSLYFLLILFLPLTQFDHFRIHSVSRNKNSSQFYFASVE